MNNGTIFNDGPWFTVAFLRAFYKKLLPPSALQEQTNTSEMARCSDYDGCGSVHIYRKYNTSKSTITTSQHTHHTLFQVSYDPLNTISQYDSLRRNKLYAAMFGA